MTLTDWLTLGGLITTLGTLLFAIYRFGIVGRKIDVATAHREESTAHSQEAAASVSTAQGMQLAYELVTKELNRNKDALHNAEVQITTLQGQVATLQGQVGVQAYTAQQQIATLQAQLDFAVREKTLLVAEREDLARRVTALQAQLNEPPKEIP